MLDQQLSMRTSQPFDGQDISNESLHNSAFKPIDAYLNMDEKALNQRQSLN